MTNNQKRREGPPPVPPAVFPFTVAGQAGAAQRVADLRAKGKVDPRVEELHERAQRMRDAQADVEIGAYDMISSGVLGQGS